MPKVCELNQGLSRIGIYKPAKKTNPLSALKIEIPGMKGNRTIIYKETKLGPKPVRSYDVNNAGKTIYTPNEKGIWFNQAGEQLPQDGNDLFAWRNYICLGQ